MNSKQANILFFVIVLVVALLAGAFVYPAGFGTKYRPWHLGLDLVGGSHLIYEVDMSSASPRDRESVLSGLRDVIERRVNTFGVSEPQVFTAKEGDAYRVVVELAGIKDVNQAVAQIGKTALLDFREVDEAAVNAASSTTDANGDTTLSVDQAFKETGLTGKYLVNAQITYNQAGQPEIAIAFNDEGSQMFEDITGRNIGKQLAIYLDGEPISAPVVNAKIIGGNAVITGRFTLDEATQLAGLLNAGALPAPVQLVSEQTVSATLGFDSLGRAIYAGLIGTLLIMLFMILYYRTLGVYAVAALLIYIVITLAVFKVIPITMSLAGIAGFILSIGMAVDANILIFERSKEELAKGLSKVAAAEEGFRRAWPSIRDSNISTIITTGILYYYTTSFVRGFALTLFLGVILSMFSAIIVTRTLLRLFTKNSTR